MHIQNLTLTDTTITATIEHNGTEVEYEMTRNSFEHWLTEGTGQVTYNSDTATLNEYWAWTKEVNDTHAKEHIGYYIKAKKSTDFDMIYKHTVLLDAISAVPDTEQRIAITNALRIWNDAKTEYYQRAFDRVAKIREV